MYWYNVTAVPCENISTNTHIVLQETDVFPAKCAIGQRGHQVQVKCGQSDSGSFSARHSTASAVTVISLFLQAPSSDDNALR